LTVHFNDKNSLTLVTGSETLILSSLDELKVMLKIKHSAVSGAAIAAFLLTTIWYIGFAIQCAML
jgi:hypothetical protein